MRIATGNDVFESGRDLVDVTSLNRPDTGWVLVDAHGHEHRWFVDGQPATAYRPNDKYETPTLVCVKDGEEFYEGDDEPHDVGHLECIACGEHIEPHYTADTDSQYIPGLKWCRINGEPVSEEEFTRRWTKAQTRP